MTITTRTASDDAPTVPIPTVPPAAPKVGRPRRAGHSIWRPIRTFFVALLLVAGAAAGGTAILRHRLATQEYVTLGNAVLVADTIPVGIAQPAVVTSLMVTEQSQVSAGQDLARLQITSPDPTAPPKTETLRAPMAGMVVSVKVPVGGVVQAGQPLVTMYDRSKLTFDAQVPVDRLRHLRLGMTASIKGPGLGHPVTARLDHVVPYVAGDQNANPNELTVVLVPLASQRNVVGSLVPGLPFTATVDTRTARGGTPAVNSAG